ncbi:hypothetical protein D4S03_06690, partial [bacterium]
LQILARPVMFAVEEIIYQTLKGISALNGKSDLTIDGDSIKGISGKASILIEDQANKIKGKADLFVSRAVKWTMVLLKFLFFIILFVTVIIQTAIVGFAI